MTVHVNVNLNCFEHLYFEIYRVYQKTRLTAKRNIRNVLGSLKLVIYWLIFTMMLHFVWHRKIIRNRDNWGRCCRQCHGRVVCIQYFPESRIRIKLKYTVWFLVMLLRKSNVNGRIHQNSNWFAVSLYIIHNIITVLK